MLNTLQFVSKESFWMHQNYSLNVRVPSFAPTVGAKMRLKNTWFNLPKRQLSLNAMIKINNGSVSQCLLHCLKRTELKCDEAFVRSDGWSKLFFFFLNSGKSSKMRKICPFLFSQKICFTSFIIIFIYFYLFIYLSIYLFIYLLIYFTSECHSRVFGLLLS